MKRSVYFLYSFTCLVSFIMILLVTTTACAEWHYQDSGVNVNLRDVCFVDELHGWAVGENSTIIATTNGGETWVKQECPVEGMFLIRVDFVTKNVGYCINGKKGTIFQKPTILGTRDEGKTWVEKETGIEQAYFSDLKFVNENIGWVVGYDIHRSGIIIHTKDGGDSWELQVDLSTHENLKSHLFSAVDFVGENIGWALCSLNIDNFDDTNVLHTTNGGKEWNEISVINGGMFNIIAVSKDSLWICFRGLIKSYDGGLIWSKDKFDSINEQPRAIYPLDGQRAYVSFYYRKNEINKLRYTDDGGNTFIDLFEIPSPCIIKLSGIDEEYVWCLRLDGKIVRYSTKNTFVKENINSEPCIIELMQNRPNPFNASTIISFFLKKREKVTLTVYDITGRKISILASEELASGNHSVVWDGKNDVNGSEVASGIYIYELRTKKLTTHKKMLLIR